MANGFGFNVGNRIANWPEVEEQIPGVAPGTIPGNLDVGFPGLTGTQSVPAAQPGGIGGFFKQNPAFLPTMLAQASRIVNPYQDPTITADIIKMMQGGVASRALQQDKLTPADQDGDTKTRTERKAGSDGRIIEVTTTEKTLPRDTIGGAIATHPLKPR